jgi:hypothetical protein
MGCIRVSDKWKAMALALQGVLSDNNIQSIQFNAVDTLIDKKGPGGII